jgi:hypothetical protein
MTKAERTAFNKNGAEAQKARRANFTPDGHEAHKKKGRDAWANQTEERCEEISLQRKQKYNEEGGKERVKARRQRESPSSAKRNFKHTKNEKKRTRNPSMRSAVVRWRTSRNGSRRIVTKVLTEACRKRRH